MASGPSVLRARQALDMWLAGGGVIRLWTVAPAFDGTGGTESVPGGGAPTASFGAAVAGSGAQIAKATTTAPPTFASMPDPSSAIVAISVHDPADNSLIAVDRAVTGATFGSGWTVGQSPQFNVTVPFVQV